MITCYHADKAVEANNTPNVLKWRNMTQIKAYLKSLRMDGDPGMPKTRDELETRYIQWAGRTRFHLVPDEDTMQKFRHWKRAFEGGKKKK